MNQKFNYNCWYYYRSSITIAGIIIEVQLQLLALLHDCKATGKREIIITRESLIHSFLIFLKQ